MKFWLSLAAGLFLISLDGRAENPEKTAKPAEGSKKSAAASPSPAGAKGKASGEEAPLDIPGIVGVPVKGLKIPYRNPEGKLLMLLEADTASKIDDTRVEFQNLKVDTYDDDGSKFIIEVPTSVFNLETRILKSNSRVLIHRDDFQITGDAVEFNTKTRFGKIIGNIKMTILSTERFDQ